MSSKNVIDSIRNSLPIEPYLTQMQPNIISICLVIFMIMMNRIAPTVTLEMKSKIEGGTIFICSETATINGILDANGDVRSYEWNLIIGLPKW